ncbi:leucyl aminopeptidase [Microbacterium sp. VKM Ac-2923]|uniref:leucyl aminopeptidase n=1 Tax=Microbacterium sp. VKM Ac-2923 TaxID=2929476 RepID=UPI001FB3D7DE|nr:leucyl aminopeptidase [Microbacterium sp. VKM Ac-2923]MCJ1707400.1 leucyl aminopeptidase [Microbacterium sp. VKM Ac-2923]
MPFPSVAYTDAPVLESDADAILLIVPTLTEGAADPDGWEGLGSALAAVGFTGGANSFQRVHVPGVSTPVAAVGAGTEPDESALRDAAGVGLRQLTGFAHVAIQAFVDAPWRPLAEGAALGGYRFADYKKKSAKARASRVSVAASAAPTEADTVAVAAVAGAVALVKDLVTTPAEWLGPADFATAAADAVAGLPVEVEVLDEVALREGGYGGILGVGQGSDRPPRLVRLRYSPADAQRHVALVGKGITFDTGGLSLKPAASMVGMKYDMCGAATVLAVLKAAAEMRLPVTLSAWLCIADNMPSGRATRPGDVLRMLDGTTVEVLNTDAEGRLVLADGLVAASRENPDLIVDVATLTGAITVALGNRHTGVMGDDDAVAAYLAAAGRAAELAWQLPLPEHMVDDLDSPIADLQNAKIGDPAGGSLFAGLFLRHFVGRVSEDADAARIPWVHLDIAGVGMNKSAPFGYTDKGVTGATVRSLIEMLTTEAAR